MKKANHCSGICPRKRSKNIGKKGRRAFYLTWENMRKPKISRTNILINSGNQKMFPICTTGQFTMPGRRITKKRKIRTGKYILKKRMVISSRPNSLFWGQICPGNRNIRNFYTILFWKKRFCCRKKMSMKRHMSALNRHFHGLTRRQEKIQISARICGF